MAERIEALFAMVAPHPAFADAAKCHVRRGEVHHRVVDTAAAKRDFLQHALFRCAVRGKEIERQGLLARFYKADRFL